MPFLYSNSYLDFRTPLNNSQPSVKYQPSQSMACCPIPNMPFSLAPAALYPRSFSEPLEEVLEVNFTVPDLEPRQLV